MFFDETGGKVRYQYGKGRAEEEWMDYLSASTCAVGTADRCIAQAGLEFIARITSHIPDKGQVMIRYYLTKEQLRKFLASFVLCRCTPQQWRR